MDYVKKRTHIIGHVRFLEAGAVARDLYDWGMLWSGQQETDGAIPMAAVLASPWGAGGKKNVVVAQKLVDVGLWARTDGGYQILRWEEQGNATKAQLDEKRESARERMRSRRGMASDGPKAAPCSGEVRANETRSARGVPSSPSTYVSGSDLGGAGGERPEWADAAIEAVSADTGETFDAAIVWTTYQGSRESQSKPLNAPDLRRFLGSWAANQKRDRMRERDRPSGTKRGAEITKQPFDENAPWLKVGA